MSSQADKQHAAAAPALPVRVLNKEISSETTAASPALPLRVLKKEVSNETTVSASFDTRQTASTSCDVSQPADENSGGGLNDTFEVMKPPLPNTPIVDNLPVKPVQKQPVVGTPTSHRTQSSCKMVSAQNLSPSSPSSYANAVKSPVSSRSPLATKSPNLPQSSTQKISDPSFNKKYSSPMIKVLNFSSESPLASRSPLATKSLSNTLQFDANTVKSTLSSKSPLDSKSLSDKPQPSTQIKSFLLDKENPNSFPINKKLNLSNESPLSNRSPLRVKSSNTLQSYANVVKSPSLVNQSPLVVKSLNTQQSFTQIKPGKSFNKENQNPCPMMKISNFNNNQNISTQIESKHKKNSITTDSSITKAPKRQLNLNISPSNLASTKSLPINTLSKEHFIQHEPYKQKDTEGKKITVKALRQKRVNPYLKDRSVQRIKKADTAVKQSQPSYMLPTLSTVRRVDRVEKEKHIKRDLVDSRQPYSLPSSIITKTNMS